MRLSNALLLYLAMALFSLAMYLFANAAGQYLQIRSVEAQNQAKYYDWQYALSANEATYLRVRREKSCLKDNPKRKEICYK